jgi:exodeoxyribonuclease-3
MKLVSLNIRHGGGKRSSQIIDWLGSQSADFVLLTEWRSNASGKFLKEALQEAGYTCFGASRDGSANGALVAAKCSFDVLRLTPRESPRGEILAADTDSGMRVLCCYSRS